ncbi:MULTISPECIES: hypothetical protein [unclassified Bacillus (in: firmicutes)]|uniref:hypothetical protein n=1 Tax=unclassified Bacillus (in: firmicutes) TaxID=185979 RepID=UPI000B86629D|nr:MULTISPECIES: hypothetical protein [unclassified Bacillus (in: firmicutes)]
MIRFLISAEFWITTAIIIILSFCLGKGNFMDGFNELANIKQNLDWYVWAYVIYRLHHHHALLEVMKNGNDEEDTS